MTAPEVLGVLVHQGSDDALHGAELGVEAEEHEHEEEEAAPEGREGHLQDGRRVGKEGQAGAWRGGNSNIYNVIHIFDAIGDQTKNG